MIVTVEAIANPLLIVVRQKRSPSTFSEQCLYSISEVLQDPRRTVNEFYYLGLMDEQRGKVPELEEISRFVRLTSG